MAKQRYIDTRFWHDSWVVNLDPIERLVYLYLLTNDKTSICGVYEIPVRMIAFETGLDKEITEKILKRFEKEKKIKYEGEWVAIKNFLKYQATHNPKIQAGINYELTHCPESLVNWIESKNFIPLSRKVRNKIGKSLRIKVLEKSSHKCEFCSNSNENELEVDHIKPIVLGGKNNIENLRILCRKCNR